MYLKGGKNGETLATKLIRAMCSIRVHVLVSAVLTMRVFGIIYSLTKTMQYTNGGFLLTLCVSSPITEKIQTEKIQ